MGEHRTVVDLEGITNSCFVAMPFQALFRTEHERVIRPAIEEAGLSCVRCDEVYTQQMIVHDVWKLIRQARVVVADLSGNNPNVLYEVGLAHAIGKPIVFLTRNIADVPFDLQGLKCLFYDVNNPFWGDDLRAELVGLVRQAAENRSLAQHLKGIATQAPLPPIPPREPQADAADAAVADFVGTWTTSWLSVQTQREHVGTLLIPSQQGPNIRAEMTVSYLRDALQTIVHETLTGTIRERSIALTGVSYAYLRQGKSRAYSLDSFELQMSDDKSSMSGKAILARGEREVVFRRVPING